MFLQNFDGNPEFSLYTREQLIQTIKHVNIVVIILVIHQHTN